MTYLVLIWLVSILAFMAAWLHNIGKTIDEKERFSRHVEHIRAIFIHERSVAKMFSDSRIRHWYVGCEELRQSTMLEE